MIEIDFVGLFNYAKHCTHLLESASSMLHTIKRMQLVLQRSVNGQSSTPSKELIDYQETLFQGLHSQITSLDKRIQNLIQLSYNLVTQFDSRTIRIDSKLMKVIALITVIFLPANTVAAIFGSEFFSGDFDADSGADQLRILKQFWLFWAIVLPLTVFLMAVGYFYWKHVQMTVSNEELRAKQS
jgi:Mg2+ and Co2+ transporter CorA